MLVSAAGKKSLDDSITYALQKELLEKNKNPDNCTICGLNNHTESTCRRKKNANNYNKFNKNNQKNDNYKRSQPSNQPSTSTSQNNYQREDQNDNSNSKFQYQNRSYQNKNYQNNGKYGNGNNSQNVKAMKNQDDDEEMILEDILNEENESSYQINEIYTSNEKFNDKYTEINFFI